MREPAPGELATRFERLIQRMKVEHKSEGLAEIVAGEYGRESMPTRLARFQIDGDHLTTEAAGASAPS